MAKAPAPDGAMAHQIGIWLGNLVGFQIMAHLAARLLDFERQAQAGVAMASTCANTAFLGTAVLTSLLGPSILPMAAAFVAVENIVVVGIAVAVLKLSKGGDGGPMAIGKTLLSGLANPTSMGALIGFLIAVSGYTLPAFLARPLEMLGGAASPAGLVALGIVMATTQSAISSRWPEIVLVVALKCVALPLTMLAAFTYAGAPPQIIVAATVLAACPSAVNVFIQARQAGIWVEQAATAVFITTLVSIVTVTLAASLAPQ